MKQIHRFIFPISVLLLFAFFSLLVVGAQRISLTADEPTYIALGYGLLTRGKGVYPLLVQRGYPPLLISLEALPIYLHNPTLAVEQLPGWGSHYAVFTEQIALNLPVEHLRLLARLPIIFLTVLLATVVFRWTAELWGKLAGLIALFFLSFDPTLLAHGRLANSDAGAVALGTAVLYSTWRWAKKPSWRWSIAVGILLGLAMLAKLSGLLWGVASGSMLVLSVLQKRQRSAYRQYARQFAVSLLLSMLLLWWGYGWEWGRLANLPFAVPAPTHWNNLFFLQNYADYYFALGMRQTGGWWWYFPLAFLIKNPLPLLLAFGLGLASLLWAILMKGKKIQWLSVLGMTFFPVFYTAIAIYESLNIGYRFMLPNHPFLYLVIGGGITYWLGKRSAGFLRTALVGSLAIWLVVGTLSVFPYEIAYFNELVGGTRGGYRYLSDSNVDWNQSSQVLKDYLSAHPQVIGTIPDATFFPAAGRYIIRASYLQGIGFYDPYAYEWFTQQEPVEIIAHNLLVYDVPASTLGWFAQCEQPGTPFSYETVVQKTATPGIRLVNFDCTQVWVYPNGGASNGIYAFHHALFDRGRLTFPSFLVGMPQAKDPVMADHLTGTRFSYEQAMDGTLPAFVLHESSRAVIPPPFTDSIFAVSNQAETALTLPLPFDAPLTLLGVTHGTSETHSLTVQSWWQVQANPALRPFSIVTELRDTNGTVLGTTEGFAIPPERLAVGDTVVQRHLFTNVPSSVSGLAWYVRVRWVDSQTFWTLFSTPKVTELKVLLDNP
ncbi:MAG TPA: glycosyltransferase family 39 protein [Anaerolineales bacterium]|nr:glycosyltransferase family 39 protein [Anaerolineales bacterium]